MGEVKSINYIGKDRRINGARLRLAVRDWITIGSLIVTLILLGGKIQWTVASNSKTIEEHELKISVVEKDIGVIKSDVSYIRGYIDKIK